jgi:hypothetical protein
MTHPDLYYRNLPFERPEEEKETLGDALICGGFVCCFLGVIIGVPLGLLGFVAWMLI